MSFTSTISSWPRSNVVVSTSSGSCQQPGEYLLVGPGHPRRGLAQALAVGVLTDRDEQLADGASARFSSNSPIGARRPASRVGHGASGAVAAGALVAAGRPLGQPSQPQAAGPRASSDRLRAMSDVLGAVGRIGRGAGAAPMLVLPCLRRWRRGEASSLGDSTGGRADGARRRSRSRPGAAGA